MKTFRGPLHRLKINGYEGDLDITRTPLGQTVDRAKLLARSVSPIFVKVRRRSTATVHSENSKQHQLPKLVEAHDHSNPPAINEEPLGVTLGNSINDWVERPFELCQTTCELRYQSSKVDLHENRSSTSTPGMISLGFIQADTSVCAGPLIESADRNPESGEKLSLSTILIAFQVGMAIYPRYIVLGHALEAERDRWLRAMQALITNKATLQQGWRHFYLQSLRSNEDKAAEWIKNREGNEAVHMNMLARRKARLQNGKVLQDVPKVFDKYSEECPDWPIQLSASAEAEATSPTSPSAGSRVPRVMDASRIVEALAELGLELAPKVSKRVLEEVRKSPPCPDLPSKVDLRRFELIFRSCCVEFLVSPSEEMKQNLLRIMQDSKNPFLSLLSPSEQTYLIGGKDADGRNVCTYKSYPKDTILVQQGDEGDSMFIIIDGALGVVVTYGSGAATVQKEVAVLAAGSVMGEMSLVLGKPRSATCIVKSESASVAEIAKTAMVRLLEERPSLSRQLEDMVHRRDASNYLNAGKTANAMALYRQRGTGHATTAVAPAGGGGGGGGHGDAGGTSRRSGNSSLRSEGSGTFRSPSRIQSRTGGKVRARTTHGGLPALFGGGGSGLPYHTGIDDSDAGGMIGARRVKVGRWVKCRGIYVFVVD